MCRRGEYASGLVLRRYRPIFFLSVCGRKIAERLGDANRCRIFRYVDDFLVLGRPADAPSCGVEEVLDIFRSCGDGLSFTHEEPVNGHLQFLDLRLSLERNHICWTYEPRSKKGILPFSSAHSKLVKRGIASSCLEASLRRSCAHTAQASFTRQVARLQKAGYPQRVLVDVADTLIKKFKGTRRQPRERAAVRPVVIPYVHSLTHNLKKVADRYDVPIVFSAPNKLSRLCRRINNPRESADPCNTKHRNRYTECATGVIYEIPMSCGSSYIGQTGRCFNDRAREHAAATRATPSGHLAMHCSRCSCTPSFSDTRFLARYADRISRELREAFEIKEKGEDCISDTSVSLSAKEHTFLRRGLHRM